MEVLSDAGTPRINSIDEAEADDDEKEDEDKISETKSDSGAGDSEASTIGKDDHEEEEVTEKKDEDSAASKLLAAAAVAAPTIAAGGTVFATAAKRSKSMILYLLIQIYPIYVLLDYIFDFVLGVPPHLRNVRSVIAKTFHENENYNSSIYLLNFLHCEYLQLFISRYRC